MFLKNLLSRIKTSYIKSLKGEESFWVVLFGWGLGVCLFMWFISVQLKFLISYITSFKNIFYEPRSIIDLIGLYALYSPVSFFGAFEILFILIYPLLFFYALIKNLRNGVFVMKFVFLLLIVVVLFFEKVYTYVFAFDLFILMESLALFHISPIGWIVGFISIFYLIKQMYHLLKNK